MGAEGSGIPDSDAQIEIEESWITPPFQPLRALGAALLTASGFGLYEFVLVSFWSAPWMGIHDRIPWPAFALLAVAMLGTVAGIRLALRLDSPHAKMGFGLFAFLACVMVGMGGGRFISYAMRGTLNPPYKLNLSVGQRFPAFALPDQSGAIRRGPVMADADATLIYVYRGDFCPFARFELADLTRHADEFRRARINVVGISADPVERSKMLAGYLHTEIPLLGDSKESVLAPLGLVQRHIDGQPDNAIPAFFVLDRDGVVRWIFASRYYRELPRVATLLDAAKSVVAK
jgi:thioredoxin-dependent peroxiredoxin